MAKNRRKKKYGNDDLVNYYSNLGTPQDPRQNTSITITRELSEKDLEAMYRTDWVSSKSIDIPINDMTREWRTFEGIGEKDRKLLEDTERSLGLQNSFTEYLQWGDLYGGSVLWMILPGKQDTEIRYEKVKKNDLKNIIIMDKTEIMPVSNTLIEDPRSPWFGESQFYEIIKNGHGQSSRLNQKGTDIIHRSRLIPYYGKDLPRITRLNNINDWGDSSLRRLYDAILNNTVIDNSIVSLVFGANLDVIGIEGLTGKLKNQKGRQEVKTTFDAVQQFRAFNNIILHDAKQMYDRKSIPFSGLEKLIDNYLGIVAAAADIPKTRFLGASPGGLDSTGDSDLSNYYDSLRSRQIKSIQPRLDVFDQVFIRSTLGKMPRNIFYEFNSLWQLNPVDKAKVIETMSKAFKNFKEMDVFTTEEVRSFMSDKGYIIPSDIS